MLRNKLSPLFFTRALRAYEPTILECGLLDYIYCVQAISAKKINSSKQIRFRNDIRTYISYSINNISNMGHSNQL